MLGRTPAPEAGYARPGQHAARDWPTQANAVPFPEQLGAVGLLAPAQAVLVNWTAAFAASSDTV